MVEGIVVSATGAFPRRPQELKTSEVRVSGVIRPGAFVFMDAHRLQEPSLRGVPVPRHQPWPGDRVPDGGREVRFRSCRLCARDPDQGERDCEDGRGKSQDTFPFVRLTGPRPARPRSRYCGSKGGRGGGSFAVQLLWGRSREPPTDGRERSSDRRHRSDDQEAGAGLHAEPGSVTIRASTRVTSRTAGRLPHG